jgi:hypothetical protein
MYRTYWQTMSILTAAALCVGATAASAASAAPDRQKSMAKLDASAGELQRSLSAGPRVGALERHETRRQLAQIRREHDRLAHGGSVEPDRLAALTGAPSSWDLSSCPFVTERLNDRRDVVERRVHGMSPRMGAIERAELREDLADLDALIADVENGRQIDLDRVDRVIGLMQLDASSTPQDRLEVLEIQRASDLRQLHSKVGAMQRMRIRQEIEDIDRSIQRIEMET